MEDEPKERDKLRAEHALEQRQVALALEEANHLIPFPRCDLRCLQFDPRPQGHR